MFPCLTEVQLIANPSLYDPDPEMSGDIIGEMVTRVFDRPNFDDTFDDTYTHCTLRSPTPPMSSAPRMSRHALMLRGWASCMRRWACACPSSCIRPCIRGCCLSRAICRCPARPLRWTETVQRRGTPSPCWRGRALRPCPHSTVSKHRVP